MAPYICTHIFFNSKKNASETSKQKGFNFWKYSLNLEPKGLPLLKKL